MPELPSPNTRAHHLPGHGTSGQSGGTSVVGDLRSRLLRISVLPAAAMALLGVAAASLLAVDGSLGMVYTVLGVVVVGCAVVLITAASRANAVTRAVHQQFDSAGHEVQRRIDTLRSWTARGQEEIQRFVKQVRSGERPAPRGPEAAPAEGSDPFALLAHDLRQVQRAAEVAVVQAADVTLRGGPDQRVAVFVNLARRLQSLVHREIQKLDELEHQVEDPDLLKGLFFVDHLATGVRRQAESLAVLGGAVPRRQWSSPVKMYAVLRSAVAEVEQYARVKVVQPIEGTLRGDAVADIIHLVAELVENATMFSPPNTEVTLRAQKVTAGLAVEVDDRGLGMPLEDQQRINHLLTAPGQIDIGELLTDGRIGLWVVSELARRHGVAVRLQTNIYGGIQAVLVLPHSLLGDGPQDGEPNQLGQSAPRELNSAVTSQAHGAGPASASRPGSASAPSPARAPLPVASHSEVRGPSAAYSNGRHGAHSHSTTTPTSTPGGGPAQPVHERRTPATSRETAASPGGAANPRSANDVRPPLPRRREQTHLVPELREPPAANEPVAGHDPGLMAAFQRGISRGIDEEDGPADRTDRTS
jgi:signal transduction histidine kinase